MNNVGESSGMNNSDNVSGVKFDEGKVLADDVMRGFARALWQVCILGTRGAMKYTLDGHLEVSNGYVRYCNAEMRHKFSRWINGPDAVDEETEVLELVTEAWNALAKLEHKLRKDEEGENGRSKKEA